MSAIKYLSSFSAYFKPGDIETESSVFRLSYRFTNAIILASCLLLTASEFFGATISCLTDLQENVIETYCWISGTFTLNDYNLREYGKGAAAQPGVYSPQAYDEEEIEKKWTFHNYYQWVPFILCAMAFFFYIPKFIWSQFEGGLMKTISTGLKHTFGSDDDVEKRKRDTVKYISTHIKMHDLYVFKYWTCELISFVIVVLMMYLIDMALGNQFLTYGTNVVEYSQMDQEDRVDPMILIFPRMTKCIFKKFGPSGSIERHDAFCLLPLNILNEKIFILLWFWLIILAVLLGVLVLYRLVLLTLPCLRVKLMHLHNKAVPKDAIEAFASKSSIGDWWIMYVLSKNIDPIVYREIMIVLAKEIESKSGSYNANGRFAAKLYADSVV